MNQSTHSKVASFFRPLAVLQRLTAERTRSLPDSIFVDAPVVVDEARMVYLRPAADELEQQRGFAEFALQPATSASVIGCQTPDETNLGMSGWLRNAMAKQCCEFVHSRLRSCRLTAQERSPMDTSWGKGMARPTGRHRFTSFTALPQAEFLDALDSFEKYGLITLMAV